MRLALEQLVRIGDEHDLAEWIEDFLESGQQFGIHRIGNIRNDQPDRIGLG